MEEMHHHHHRRVPVRLHHVRVLWNLSKLANLCLGGAVDAFKRPYIYDGKVSHTLLGYKAQHGGHQQLAQRLCCYDMFISADLPRYDGSFPRWLTALPLLGLAFYSGLLPDEGVRRLLLFWLRSICICLLVLADFRIFYTTQGLSSGHVAVSFLESIGTVALAYRFLLHALLRTGDYSLMECLNILLQRGLFDFFLFGGRSTSCFPRISSEWKGVLGRLADHRALQSMLSSSILLRPSWTFL